MSFFEKKILEAFASLYNYISSKLRICIYKKVQSRLIIYNYNSIYKYLLLQYWFCLIILLIKNCTRKHACKIITMA